MNCKIQKDQSFAFYIEIKVLTSLLEVHGFDSNQCDQLTQVTIMIYQGFVEGTVIQANGRPNKNWLTGNHLLEYRDTSA